MRPLERVNTERNETVESEDSESGEARPKIGHPHPPYFRKLRTRMSWEVQWQEGR